MNKKVLNKRIKRNNKRKKGFTKEKYNQIENRLNRDGILKKEILMIIENEQKVVNVNKMTIDGDFILTATNKSSTRKKQAIQFFFGYNVKQNLSERIDLTSNNMTELIAVKKALKYIPKGQSVRIITDNKVTVNQINKYNRKNSINKIDSKICSKIHQNIC